MSFIPCLSWVERGAAKHTPDKLQLNREELEQIISDSRNQAKPSGKKLKDKNKDDDIDSDDDDTDNDDDITDNDDVSDVKGDISDDDIVKSYGLDDYDEEEDDAAWDGISGVTYYASNKEDPYLTVQNDEDDSDEDADLNIEPSDNLLAVCRVKKDLSILDIYVYNEDDSNWYVHHDIVLPAFPLATEWMNFDLADSTTGNFLAVSSLDSTIDIWDLDVINCLEADFVLGEKKTKKAKKKAKTLGHTDAVLDMSWNKNIRNILASASADFTVALWDLSRGMPVTSITQHTEKVQTVEWHPFESQSLLTGSFDKTVKVFDCRSPNDTHKSWDLNGEVERVIWNHLSPLYFMASTDQGFVYNIDARMDKPVFTLSAHDKAVSGMCFSSQISGCLVTASSDKKLKVWDVQSNKPQNILDKDIGLGELQCVCCCPEAPYVFAVGGETDFKIWDIRESAAVKKHFEGRTPLAASADSSTVDMATGSKQTNSTTEKTTIKNKTKKKKKKTKKTKSTVT